MKQSKYTFVITGGHHSSGLVLGQYLESQGHKIVWFGHKRASRRDSSDSAEYKEVSEAGIKFLSLQAGKGTLELSNIWRLPFGLAQALGTLRQVRPKAVISFGGYLGFTTCLAARFLGIPVFLHEQTVVAGKANLILARLARKIYLTWESSRKYYPRDKSQVVGLPLREGILKLKRSKRSSTRPHILILGGKQGANVINRAIFANLKELLQDFELTHQTGTSTYTRDMERAHELKLRLPHDLASRYHPNGYLAESELVKILPSIDVYLGRSGAHITYELALLGLPAVLIPLMITYRQEQLQNAKYLERQGQAVILSDNELTYDSIKKAIKTARAMPPTPQTNLKLDATKVISHDILQTLAK